MQRIEITLISNYETGSLSLALSHSIQFFDIVRSLFRSICMVVFVTQHSHCHLYIVWFTARVFATVSHLFRFQL